MRFECNPSTHCMLTYLFCPLSKPVNPEAKQGEKDIVTNPEAKQAQRPKLVWAMPCKQGEKDIVINPEAKQAQRPKLVWAMPCKRGEKDIVTNPEAKVMPCGCKSRTIFLIAQAD